MSFAWRSLAAAVSLAAGLGISSASSALAKEADVRSAVVDAGRSAGFTPRMPRWLPKRFAPVSATFQPPSPLPLGPPSMSTVRDLYAQPGLQGARYGFAVYEIHRDRRFLVVHVAPNSPAARAGMVPGDVVVSAESKDLRQAQLPGGPIGESLRLTIARGVALDSRVNVKLVLKPWKVPAEPLRPLEQAPSVRVLFSNTGQGPGVFTLHQWRTGSGYLSLPPARPFLAESRGGVSYLVRQAADVSSVHWSRSGMSFRLNAVHLSGAPVSKAVLLRMAESTR